MRPGNEITFALRFPGHYEDPEIGLFYNRFRYYSPTLGRYLQSDPMGIAGGKNLYAYPANPLTTVDLFGLNDGHSTKSEDGNGARRTGLDKERIPGASDEEDAVDRLLRGEGRTVEPNPLEGTQVPADKATESSTVGVRR